MKNLNNFITEKLKVNSKTKIVNDLEHKEIIDKIIYYFNINPEETKDNEEKHAFEKIKEKIIEWLDYYKEKIKDVDFACDLETLNEFIKSINKNEYKENIQKEYNTSDSLNEKCQSLLDKSVGLYKNYIINIECQHCDEKMICISYKYGTLYCLNKNLK